MRAFLSPYFLRSMARGSRVRKPAFFSAGRSSGCTRISARAIARRSAPAWPDGPPPSRWAWMSKAVHPIHGHQRSLDELLVHLVREIRLEAAPVEVELPVPGIRRTRTTASLRRPTVWMGRSRMTGSRGARASGAAASGSVTAAGGRRSLRGLGGFHHWCFRGFGRFGGIDGLGHWAHLLDLVRHRLLRGVRMLRAGVDLQLLLDLTAELVVREHADDRLLDDAVGMPLHHGRRSYACADRRENPSDGRHTCSAVCRR